MRGWPPPEKCYQRRIYRTYYHRQGLCKAWPSRLKARELSAMLLSRDVSGGGTLRTRHPALNSTS